MSAWRRKALELLPKLRVTIESSHSISDLWVELSAEFNSFVESNDEKQTQGVLDYLTWSLSDLSGSEATSVVSCGFLEDIARNKKYWQYFPSWFSRAQFNQCQGSFEYAISSTEFIELKNIYYGK